MLESEERDCFPFSIGSYNAFDTDTGEPICSEVYPGNNIDAATVNSFIGGNGIKRGIIVADKGFPIRDIESELADNKDLHYLLPLKRNSRLIGAHDALSYSDAMHCGDKDLLCKKCSVQSGRFLYSFSDVWRSGKEYRSYMDGSIKNGSFDIEKYRKERDGFGTIVFISDLDLPLKEVYRIYEERWLLELMVSQYKGDEGLTTTNVQNDYSVTGEEFVNFIATILTSRMTRKADEAGLLETMSYGDLMDDLSSAWRKVKGETVQKVKGRI